MNLPLRYKLHLGFFAAALATQIIAPRVPVFDTSHLIPLSSHAVFTENTQINPLGPMQKPPSIAQPDLPPISLAYDISELAARSSWLVPFPALRWDALHFLDVSMNSGYAYEHQYAFSPGVPIVLRLVYELKLRTLGLFFRSTGAPTYLGSWIIEIMNAFLVSLLACQACLSLHRLTRKLSNSDEFAYLSVAVFILMGAPPVVLRSVYTEPFFAWFSFEGMTACHDRRFLTASFYFALATSFRANGIILPGFILYGLVIQPVLLELVPALCETPRALTGISKLFFQSARRLCISTILYGLFLTALTIMPFIAQQYLGYITFCSNSSETSSAIHPRPWCSARLPLIFSFAQSHYWDVGFLRYWTLAQIPNFLLAMPMLALVCFSSVYLLRVGLQRIFGLGLSGKQDNAQPSTSLELSLSTSKILILLPYAIHALALSFVLFTAAHVQIALRFLPAATPWAAWAGAALVIKGTAGRAAVTREGSDEITLPKHNGPAPLGWYWWPLVSHLWIGWSVIWLLVSSVLWLAFLPPA